MILNICPLLFVYNENDCNSRKGVYVLYGVIDAVKLYYALDMFTETSAYGFKVKD